MRVVILGNGVAGITAALELRRLRPDWRITVVSGESTYHYSRPALMYVFMGHMPYRDTKPFEDHVWTRERIELVRAWATRVDVERGELVLHGRPSLAYDKLLLATGSKPNRFGWPGQDLDGVQGLYGLPDLKQLYETCERTRRATVVGGGLIGIELAEMLHSRGIHVALVVREKTYWGNVLPAEESTLVNRAIRARGIDLWLESELREIVDDGEGRVAGILTSDGRRVDCELVGLTAGVSPNLDVLAGSPVETDRGILVDGRLRTNVPGLFAAGDCAELRRPEGERNVVQQVWYTGKSQGEFAAHALSCDESGGDPGRYEPGLWFNSAKFLDLEYQVYGTVDPRATDVRHLYWQHENGQHALRIVYDECGVVGFDTLGLRWRHEVCERWLTERADVRHVVDGLEEAHFQPEFFRRHEASMRRAFAPSL